MIQHFKQSFFQVFTITSLWVTLLLTWFYKDQPIDILYLWNVAGIAVIFAALYGVMYNALWNHFTLRPLWNIIIASVLNSAGGLACVWLFSKEMFERVSPWWPGMLLLTVILHTVAFYFYAKADSKKKADELNKLIK
ncbi:FlaA1/EpsC-like NDP-sugar epimerase [Paenibacillus phyllosphaerae]|uniref:FlaA1/EpsC-like NDP-sugar epimerase n=1 Tax=Paenibacillus phyllosphaerae TaxID=274593 RepID=A0A7W5B2E1_9BACL|nr:hypothetical protein [Paenibacillus phyllosphaerae]MBB3113195.1 FlaA1/EpsC-like NDP-sugar epimerase [Paenibacillus phyllosphaerae]